MPKKRTALLSEQALQEQIVKLLAAWARPDVCWFAVPNGELRNYKTGTKLKAAGLRAGVADLIFLIDGRAHAVELKTEIGMISARQQNFRESWERAGGYFHAAFGLDQALGVLQGIQAFRAGLRFTGAAAMAPSQAKTTNQSARNGRGVREGSAARRASRSPNFVGQAR